MHKPSSDNSIHTPIDEVEKNHLPKKSSQVSAKRPIRWPEYLTLIFLTICCHAPVLQSGLLWAEYDQVERSSFQSIETLTEVWTSSKYLKDDPITLSSYFLEQALPLPTSVVHHSINLLLHIFSVVILFKILTTLKLPAAFCASLVFALHPCALQTIFWSGYRTEIVALTLLLISILTGIINKGVKGFIGLMSVCLIAYWLHPANLFLPIIIGFCIFYQKTTFELKDYNRLLPLIFLAFFVGVFVHSKEAGIQYYIGEQINISAHNLFFFLKQALFPTILALFHPIQDSNNLRFGAIINLLPFLFLAVCYLIVIPNYKKLWARGLLLGLSSYILLSIYSLGSYGSFIDGTPAQVSYNQHIALPAIICTVICSLGAVARKMRTSGSILWWFGFGLLILIQFSFTTLYARSLSNRAQMWYNISEQWPNSLLPKLALLHTTHNSDAGSKLLTQNQSIDLLENILQQQPSLISERKLLARIYRKLGQNTNAIRHYKHILRETEPNNKFLSEAADFYDSLTLNWEADKARQRIKK
jgi:tetratricopeptide (TPR) repeat protein